MRKNSPITVLLCSYNGSRYIQEQIDSILNQTYWNDFCRLLICDDNSTDNTVSLVNSVAEGKKNIQLIHNTSDFSGAAANFSHALNFITDSYVLFCDQDDYWYPNKIEILMNKILTMEAKFGQVPLLVFSDLEVVDENLYQISKSFLDYQHISEKWRKSFKNLLMQNLAPGCSMLLNPILCNKVTPIPMGVAMHDWWVILIARAFGNVGFVSKSLVKYRQHSNNEVGAKNIRLFSVLKNIGPFLENSKANLQKQSTQAKLLISHYEVELKERLSSDDFQSLQILSNWGGLSRYERLRALFSGKLNKNTRLRNLGLFFLCLKGYK